MRAAKGNSKMDHTRHHLGFSCFGDGVSYGHENLHDMLDSLDPPDNDGGAEAISDDVFFESCPDLKNDSTTYTANDNSNSISGTKSAIRKRRALKKAPNAPKRFKSAYICFVMEKMDEVKKLLPQDIKVTETMKTLASMWRSLAAEERQYYERMAEVDKARYFQEMEHYRGPMQVPNKRQKKPPGAPTRAMSAFLSFSQMMRPLIRTKHPDLKNTDISGVLAKQWKNASEEEKRPHLEKELKEREKYHEDMARWKEEVLQTAQEKNMTFAMMKNHHSATSQKEMRNPSKVSGQSQGRTGSSSALQRLHNASKPIETTPYHRGVSTNGYQRDALIDVLDPDFWSTGRGAQPMEGSSSEIEAAIQRNTIASQPLFDKGSSDAAVDHLFPGLPMGCSDATLQNLAHPESGSFPRMAHGGAVTSSSKNVTSVLNCMDQSFTDQQAQQGAENEWMHQRMRSLAQAHGFPMKGQELHYRNFSNGPSNMEQVPSEKVEVDDIRSEAERGGVLENKMKEYNGQGNSATSSNFSSGAIRAADIVGGGDRERESIKFRQFGQSAWEWYGGAPPQQMPEELTEVLSSGRK